MIECIPELLVTLDLVEFKIWIQ